MRLAVTLFAVCAAARAQMFAPAWAITNARVVISPGKILNAANIIVRNGLIESVAEGGALPSDVRIFAGDGLTVYPGLIDAATNYGFPQRPASGTLPPAATPPPLPAVPFGPPDDIASPDRYLRPQPVGVSADVVAAARIAVPAQPDPRRGLGFTAVLAIPPEGHWQGASALVTLRPGTAAQSIVISPVAMHVSFALPPGFQARYPSSLMGVFAVLRQSLLRAQQYRDSMQLYEASGRRGLPRPTFDPTSAALIPVLEGRIPVVFEADSSTHIQRVIRFADEFKLKPIILGGAEAWRVTDLLKARGIPVLVSLTLLPAPQGHANFQLANPVGESPSNDARHIAAEENPGKLEKAGIPFAFVTGSWTRTERFRDKLRTAISRGLSPEGALRALTLSPAEILGAGAQLGTIEAGKIANLTITKGDLLDAQNRVTAVMIDGQFYYPTPVADRARLVSAAKPPATPAATPQSNTQQPGQVDDPAPVTPGAAVPPSTSASPIPSRRPPDPEPAPADLVIRNATLLTITKGVISNGSVWIHDGKIQEVGATVNAPPAAKIIDGTGRFVMPGIVDSHSHSATTGGVNEAGPSVTAQTRIRDVVDPEDVNLYREAAAGVTTLNILHGSANAIGGENAVIKLKWGSPLEKMFFPEAPRGIKMALGENPRRVNAAGRGARFPATRMGVENVIRESFKSAREYARLWSDYETRTAKGEKLMPPERNLTLDALRDVLEGKVLVHAHCYRADEISMLLDLADEYGFKIRSLQHVLEGYKVADKIRKHGAGASTFADFWGYKMEAFDGTPYNAALMVRAGVRTALNSDGDERARRLYQEASKAIKYGGLTEEEALRLITTEPAWMLGIEKRVGAIEPGMDADLAIFNAHPFSAYARVEMTLVDGQTVFDRERDLKHRVPWKEEFEPEPSPTSEGLAASAHEDYR